MKCFMCEIQNFEISDLFNLFKAKKRQLFFSKPVQSFEMLDNKIGTNFDQFFRFLDSLIHNLIDRKKFAIFCNVISSYLFNVMHFGNR